MSRLLYELFVFLALTNTTKQQENLAYTE